VQKENHSHVHTIHNVKATSNNVEATFHFVEPTLDLVAKTATMSNKFIVKFRPFYKVECCFDNVAISGNNVKEKQRLTLLSFWQQCRTSFS